MIIIFAILGLLSSIFVFPACGCVDTFPYQLDIGFYWASYSGGIEWHKSCPDALSSAFDPEKESKVYFHGLQPGAVRANHRFFINDTEVDPAVAAYLALGYNVGVFQWTQFADEPLTNFIRAEGKINATDFVAAMNYVYMTPDDTLQVADGPGESVTQIAYAHYIAHWPIGTDIPAPHIIGHSLGSQLVVYLAEIILTSDPEATLPRRVTLLDPVFSDSAKPYLMRNNCGLDIPSVLGCYMGHLVDAEIAVDLYRASFINRCIFSSDNNVQMVMHSAAVALKLTEWGSMNDGYCWNSDLLTHFTTARIGNLAKQISEQHRAVIEWYLRSGLESSVPRICRKRTVGGKEVCDPTRTAAPSGAMSDEDVLGWATGDPKQCFYQFLGPSTKNASPSDDLFYVDDCFAFNK